MNLLVVNDYGSQGSGAENRIRVLLEEFRRKGYFGAIHLVQAYWQDSDQCINGIHQHYCPTPKDTLAVVRSLIAQGQADIVQLHNFHLHSDLFLSPVIQKRLPIVWFAHDYWAFCGRRTLMPVRAPGHCAEPAFKKCFQCIGPLSMWHLKKTRRLINQFSAGIAPSNYVIDLHSAQGIMPGRWELIRPWIDPLFFEPEPAPRTFNNRIIFVGGLSAFKGAAVVVSALNHLRQQIPDIRLQLVGPEQKEGSGPRRCIERILKTDGTADCVEFSGFLSGAHLRRAYWANTIFICAPLWPELFGLTWAEAMASGCVVVASRIGSIPEISSERIAFFKPGDEKELASVVVKLLRTKSALPAVSVAMREYAQAHFRVEPQAQALSQLYQRLWHAKN